MVLETEFKHAWARHTRTQTLYHPRLYTAPAPIRTPCRAIEHVSRLLKGELHDHNHHSAAAKIDWNPDSNTDKHKSWEWNRKSFFFPARLKRHLEHLLLEEKNTTASNSACLRASENTMHFHKCIFIQFLVGLSKAQLADLNYVHPQWSEIIQWIMSWQWLRHRAQALHLWIWNNGTCS